MFIRYGVRTSTTIVVRVGVSMVAVSHMDGTQFVFPRRGETHGILTDHGHGKLSDQGSHADFLQGAQHPSFQSAQKDYHVRMMLHGRLGQGHKFFGTGVTPIQKSG